MESEQKLSGKELEEALVEFIKVRDHVTFVEIQRFLAAHIETEGTFSYEYPDLNIVFWAGMSEEMVDTFVSIRDRVYAEPANPLCYLIDGATLPLPIAKRPPKKGYKNPRWAPVVLRTLDKEGYEGLRAEAQSVLDRNAEE